MIALAALTIALAGVLTYGSVEPIVLQRTMERLDLSTELLAHDLAASTQSARDDVLGLRSAAALDGVVRATVAGGVHPLDGTGLDVWIERMASHFAAVLAAKPLYDQLRVIGAADQGREIVRVDRSGPNRAIRIVPKEELQRKSARRYFQDAAKLPDGEVYVSQIELNRELDVVVEPRTPVVRTATPIHAPGGELFGILIINVNLDLAFAQLRSAISPSHELYIVNARGDYLLHPDRNREFEFEFGKVSRVQDDFPEISPVVGQDDPEPQYTRDRAGRRFGIAMASALLAGVARVTVIEAAPYSEVLKSTHAIRNAVLLAGLIAIVLALLLAVFLGRSLTRPLARLTTAVELFGHGDRVPVPTTAAGEIGALARAFERMSQEVNDRAATMRRDAEIFDSIMTGMADAVLLVDQDARVLFANRACKALLGSQSEAGSGDWQSRYEVFQADDVTRLDMEDWPINRVLRGEELNEFELSFRRAGEQSLIRLVASARPIRNDAGAPNGGVLVLRDVTAIKETEQKLHHAQKLEAIGQLTGGVAHDFNNILAVILGTSEMLADGVADRPELAALAARIDAAVIKGATLTQQLLAFARRQPLRPVEINVNEAVAEAVKLLIPTLGEQIEIETRLVEEPWPVFADPSQLSSSLINLAINARDAMPGGGKLTLETGNVELDENYARANAEVSPGPYVMISVSDSGEGIPPALRDQVFEPFFTTKEVGKGTGLGLSMVYGFLKQSGGHIKLYSEEGHGTTIKLYLPYDAQQESAAGQASPAEPVARGNETILVVEDNEPMLANVVTQLEGLGYKTCSAKDGPEALAIVDDGLKFDLLLTDVILSGGLNGPQLAEQIAVRRPGLRVLYTSGYTENAILRHGQLEPGMALLVKPYRKIDLAREIRDVLGRRPQST